MNLTKIDQAHIIALIGTLGTAIVTLVPSWSTEMQIIVAALGTIVSNLYPVVKAIEKLADSNVSARDVEARAVAVARAEIGKVDFNQLVNSAVSAQSVPDLEAKVEAAAKAEIGRLLANLGQTAVTPVAPAV